MALDHERIVPLTHPNRPALAKVIEKAGRGAATDWNTINKNEKGLAGLPRNSYVVIKDHQLVTTNTSTNFNVLRRGEQPRPGYPLLCFSLYFSLPTARLYSSN